jgi:glycosyltransferase involved in cell wall biosynthesis
MKKELKVAIVHDWFVSGGAEQVVYQIHKLFPNAPIYTAYCSDEWLNKFENTVVVTSYMQHWPFSRIRKFLPILRQRWFSKLDFSDFDLVISSSGAEAKGINTNEKTLHVNYCHSPTHYYWSRYDEYIKNPGFGKLDFLARFGLKLFIDPLRKWDYKAAQKPNYIIANSSYIQRKIKEYYDRESTVIFPPVDTKFFKSKIKKHDSKTENFVIVGRQTPYKRIDLAVKSCSKLNLNLNVIGDGPEHKKLFNIAGPSITFYKNLSKTELRDLLNESSGFIFPGLDDFGIAAVEALSVGVPIIAYKDGGALDYVIESETGKFFDKQTVDSLVDTLKSFNSKDFSSERISKKAKEFSTDKFQKNFQDYLNELNH